MSSEVYVVKGAPEDVKTINVSVKDVKGEMTKEDKVMKKEEEDTTFDGGFIKVDKEGVDTKDGEKTEKQVPIERSSSSESSQKELYELQEKVKALKVELNQELEKNKASETRSEQELLAIKDLKGKVSEQESINLMLREKLKEKVLSKDQEGIIRTAYEKLTKVLKEKEVHETSVAEITREAAKTKETCNELEKKLKISDEKFCKTDALLSQALSNNSDLEKKLKSLVEQVSQLKSALAVSKEVEKDSARQMQEYQEKLTKLDSSLNQSSARISDLEKDLKTALQKGAEHEDLGKMSTERSVELEGLFQTSQSELVKSEEKLKSAEERLEKQAREIDEANRRSTEIKDLHKHSDLSIQKAMKDLNIIDTEAKSLTEKSKHLKERIRLYEDKLAEASAHSFSLKHDLDKSSLENELLSDTNNQLKIKIQELEGFLDAQKETATERYNQRDIEAKDLATKLQSHENLIEEHKSQVLKVSEVADTRKMELEKALLKLKTFEDTIKELEKENGSLAEVNLKLNQELANHGSDTSGFQEMLSALEAEKDQTAKELEASTEAVEKLTNKLTSEEKEAVSKKHSELEASPQEELEAKKCMIVHLESLLKDLEQKVQLADAKSKETETMGKGEVEVKSGDIDFSFPTSKQRKSKEESDASASHSSSSGNVTTQIADTSHLMTLKIVLGVALVSVIIGIILGKKY
ncbi:hypothetical protein Rs2_22107 [Raphanus sativus]|nr:hypothetical protein Rs2_22107 [Raphanus sativus]